MGFSDAWNKIRGWSSRAWEEATLVNIGNFTYKTAGYILSMPRATLSAGRSILSDPDTFIFAKHMGEAGLHIFIPMIFSYLNDEMQRYGRTYLEENEEPEGLSIYTIMIPSLVFFNTALWFFDKREQAQGIIQAGILTLESSNVVLPRLPAVKICQDCTRLQFLEGSFRDFIAYWTIKLILIEGVRYIPWIGEGVAIMLTVCHNGSYIATLIWSPLCGRHLDHNLNEHPEFILAQGLTHAGASLLVVGAIEWGTGIPRQYYETPIQQLALVGQVLIGAHGEMPELVKHSDRLPKEPVRAYEMVVKSGIDFTIDNSKAAFIFTIRKSKEVLLPKVLPLVRPLFNRLPKTPRVPWDKVGHVAVLIGRHKVTGVVKFLILPPILRGPEEFVNDSFVSPHWRGLRDKVIKAMLDIEWVSANYAFRLISTAPGTTGEAVEVVMGTPKIVTETVLYILRNRTFIAKVAAQRRILEGIHSGPPPETQPDPDAQLLRGQTETAKIIPHPQITEKVDGQSQQTGQSPIKLRIPTEDAMERKLRKQSSEEQLENRLDSQLIRRRPSNDAQLEKRIELRGENSAAFFKSKPKPKPYIIYDAQSGLEDEFLVVNNDSGVEDELGEGFELVDDDTGQTKARAFV